MESEIDLRPYIVAVLRRWSLILICALLVAAIGVWVGMSGRNTRSASADVLIIPISSQVTLDPRFQTTNNSQATNPITQREALVRLANSQAIAEEVMAQLGIAANPGDPNQAQALLGAVSVDSASDLMQITVYDPDPARALTIAEAWGQSYERLVANIYTRGQLGDDLLSDEIAAAQQRYEAAQAELEAFVSEGKIIQVEGQVTQIEDLLTSSHQAQQLLYSDYLTRTRELDLILADAQTLRDQAGTQSGDSFAERFAALLLRARTVTSEAPVVQLSAADFGAEGDPNALAGLDELVAVLARRREQIQAQANELAQAIASNGSTPTGLSADTRQRYVDQLAGLKSSYEQLLARQELLIQQRDLARDALTLLQKKSTEQQVARSSPQIEVRFVSANIDPQPSIGGRMALSGAAAAVVGLVLGIMLALLLDVIIPALRRLSRPELPQPGVRTDAPADRPIPGD